MHLQENFRYGINRKGLYSVSIFDLMTRYPGYLIVIFILLAGCDGKKKKPSMTGTDEVVVSDFIESFQLIKPTYEIADTSLGKKEKDSLLIANKVFAQFVPDTVLTRIFGKNAKPKIYSGKRVELEGKENYLFTKVVTNDKRAILVLCFGNDNKFKGYLPLLVHDASAATTQVSGIDRRFSFYKNTILKKPDGSTADGKEVYIYNEDAGQFLLIMTDPLDDRVQEVINPIDTLQKKNKFSGDYVRDKMNIVSVRDGNKPGKMNFFIHIERNNGECSGELKGEASFTSANAAVYRQPGDACSVQFNFSVSSVTIKELDACGSHRGVKCSFDLSFPKKKEPKPKASSKRTSK